MKIRMTEFISLIVNLFTIIQSLCCMYSLWFDNQVYMGEHLDTFFKGLLCESKFSPLILLNGQNSVPEIWARINEIRGTNLKSENQK